MQLLITPFAILLLLAPQWTVQTSGTTARLRGVSAVNERVAWASGSGSTVLRTDDGGATWKKLTVTSEALDFRDIDAIDEKTAYALSIGNGPASRIYKTVDGGSSWTLQFRNEDPKAFLDAMSFWDPNHGIVIGDSVDGQFYILTTSNGGREWSRVPPSRLPQALENEGAFAASGTNIAVYGKGSAWIGLGAAARARVLRTTDGGRTWKVFETPLKSGASSGIFSVAFRDQKHGVIAGGDYQKEKEAVDNLAVTSDGGATWTLVKGLSGFRSVVAYIPGGKVLVAIGPAGGDYSIDDGQTWTPLSGPGFDTFSFARGKRFGWGAGARGAIGRLAF
ncbi:MAG: WD40/YVTN/BNR-like repeat-containing protein [Pyrinomonadaceae bacterium]